MYSLKVMAKTNAGGRILTKLSKVQTAADESFAYSGGEDGNGTETNNDGGMGGMGGGGDDAEGAAANAATLWMAAMGASVDKWESMLPETSAVKRPPRTQSNLSDPMYRYFDREVAIGASLLCEVREDLALIGSVVREEGKLTNRLRSVLGALRKGQLPAEWGRFYAAAEMTASAWVNDFSRRLRQLMKFSKAFTDSGPGEAVTTFQVWMGYGWGMDGGGGYGGLGRGGSFFYPAVVL